MATPIQPAGYIVIDNEAIWATGKTADEAWAEFQRTMAENQVKLLGDDDDSGAELGAWARERDFRIQSASAALLADVESRGGAISWRYMAGVACTPAEEAEAYE